MAAWNADRDRLYVVLLKSRETALLHWAFIVGSRRHIEQARRGEEGQGLVYGVWKQTASGRGYKWGYQEYQAIKFHEDILLRGMVAKVSDKRALENIMTTTEVKADVPEWGYGDWAKSVIENLRSSNNVLYGNLSDWTMIDWKCTNLVRAKENDGRYAVLLGSHWRGDQIPTWDFEQDEETVL